MSQKRVPPVSSPVMRNGKPRASLVFTRPRAWEYLSRDGITVSTRGIPTEFRKAFLKVLLGARECYRSIFGQRTIDRVEFNVFRDPSAELHLWTNGSDRVYLTLNKKEHLDVPQRSGVRNMHGLPHELGHIVLYRSLINLRMLPPGWGEGWAVYLASFLAVPYLFETYGPGLWPYPYDYLETEGPGPYLARIDGLPARGGDPFLVALRTLHRLDTHLGRERFGRFFSGLLKEPIRADVFHRKVKEMAARIPKPR